MKLYRLEMGTTLLFGAADSLEGMFEKRAEVDPTFHYLPVQIEEVTLEGFDITVTPKEPYTYTDHLADAQDALNELAAERGKRKRKAAE